MFPPVPDPDVTPRECCQKDQLTPEYSLGDSPRPAKRTRTRGPIVPIFSTSPTHPWPPAQQLVDREDKLPDEDVDSDAALCEAPKQLIKQMKARSAPAHPLRPVFEQAWEQPTIETT